MTEAIFGLVGVLIGSAISWFQSYWLNRQETKKASQYLAIRVSICLDEYVDLCAQTMFIPDSHDVPPDSDPMDHFTTPSPLKLPEDVDWKSIDPQLVYDILSLVGETTQAKESVAYLWGVAGGDAAFESAGDSFSEIGVRCNNLSVGLRNIANLKKKNFSSHYNPLSILKERFKQKEKRLAKELKNDSFE